MTLDDMRNGSIVTDDDCWLWQGRYSGVTPGRAAVRYMRRKALSLLLGRPLKPHEEVGCTCSHGDRCVNPAHAAIQKHSTLMRRLRPTITLAHRLHITQARRAGSQTMDMSKAREIRARVSAGETRVALAAEFDLPVSTVNQIAANKTWREIASPFPGGMT